MVDSNNVNTSINVYLLLWIWFKLWLDCKYGGYSCAYNAVPTVICSACLFLVFEDVSIGNRFIKLLFKTISKQSLEIYLFVCMFVGNWVYQPLYQLIYMRLGIVWFWIAICIVETCAGTTMGICLNHFLDKGFSLIQKKGK